MNRTEKIKIEQLYNGYKQKAITDFYQSAPDNKKKIVKATVADFLFSGMLTVSHLMSPEDKSYCTSENLEASLLNNIEIKNFIIKIQLQSLYEKTERKIVNYKGFEEWKLITFNKL